MKKCPTCHKSYPRSAHYWHRCKGRYDGFAGECKQCRRQHYKNLSDSDKNVYRQRSKENALKRKYNMTIADYSLQLQQVNYKCEICQCVLTKDTKRTAPVIDHCHETGFIRGILCNNCNSGLGYFLNSNINLQNAIEYLKRADVRIQEKRNKCL